MRVGVEIQARDDLGQARAAIAFGSSARAALAAPDRRGARSAVAVRALILVAAAAAEGARPRDHARRDQQQAHDQQQRADTPAPRARAPARRAGPACGSLIV